MQIKITKMYDLIPLRMAIMKKAGKDMLARMQRKRNPVLSEGELEGM